MNHRNSLRFAGALASALFLLVALPQASAQSPMRCAVQRSAPNLTTLEGCDFPGSKSDPVAAARAFIDAQLGELKMSAGSSELAHVATRSGLGTQHVRFQQMLAGLPVYGALVNVVQDNGGRIRRMQSSYNAYRRLAVSARKSLNRDQLDEIARQSVAAEARVPSDALQISGARQVWYPQPGGALVLAWELTVTSYRTLTNFVAIVDSATGEVYSQQDRNEYVVTGQGKAFRPNPVQSSGDVTLSDASPAGTINAELITADLPGLDENTGRLKGKFADLYTLQFTPPASKCDLTQSQIADEVTRQYFYALPDERVAQTNAYFAIDSVQRYIRTLGFNGDNTVPNGIRNYPTLANVHCNNVDNSAFSPQAPPAFPNGFLYFGNGGVPDAEDADIIVHEFGHATQFDQNPTWGCTYSGSNTATGGFWQECDMRAMGEGFGDYIAAMFHAADGDPTYQASNAACVGEWDGTAYSVLDPPCLRRVDGSKQYPAGLANPRNRHKDGEIWSRALWDIRAALGADIANQLILEHHYGLLPDTTMPQAAFAMLAVDADSFGGFNEAALRTAFCARGILKNGGGGTDCTTPSYTKEERVVAKDSFVRQALINRNDGAGLRLRLQGLPGQKTRPVVGFDLAGIDLANVKSAVLQMTIASNDQQWGRFGRPVDAHPISTVFTFVEGNGFDAGVPDPLNTPGNGIGVTWACSQDTAIENAATDCATEKKWWGGRPMDTLFGRGTAVPPAVHSNTMQDGAKVRWDVSAALKSGTTQWAIAVTFDQPGMVEYYSREGAIAADPLDAAKRAPRLIVTYYP